MSLHGWTLPQSPLGRAALLAPPPWRYSGEILAIEFFTAPERLRALSPDGFTPNPEGRCVFIFADWSASSDHDPRLLEDPEFGQYREAMVGYAGTYEGRPFCRVPYIWVDNETALIRGHVQGVPKKMGRIFMTRPVEVGQGGVRKAPGGRFSAHLSALGRRLASASVTLEAEEGSDIPWFWRTPALGTRLTPSSEPGAPIRPMFHESLPGADAVSGPVFTGEARLSFEESPFEELADLNPIRVGRGYVHAFGFSYVGGRTWPCVAEAASEAA